MKRFSIFALAAVAMFFVGCTKDIDTDITKEENIVRGELVKKTLIIEDTRVERDEASGKLTWSQGDQFKVVLLNNGTYTLDTNVYTVDHTTGTVEIPSNAVYSNGINRYVYVIENGQRIHRDVKTGKTNLSETEILEGLEEGEHVYVKD